MIFKIEVLSFKPHFEGEDCEKFFLHLDILVLRIDILVLRIDILVLRIMHCVNAK
jgi:hypothetical protein